MVKFAIKDLIDGGRCVYTYFGGSFIEIPHEEGAAKENNELFPPVAGRPSGWGGQDHLDLGAPGRLARPGTASGALQEGSGLHRPGLARPGRRLLQP